MVIMCTGTRYISLPLCRADYHARTRIKNLVHHHVLAEGTIFIDNPFDVAPYKWI